MNYNPTGGKSSEPLGGKRPAGEARPEHEVFAEAWMRCRSVAERERVVQEMREALDGWKHSKAMDAGETQKELYARIVKVGEGWMDREAAAALRETMATVHKAREAHDRDPAKGLRVVGVGAEELLRRGNTIRWVEARTNVPRSTLHRRKAA